MRRCSKPAGELGVQFASDGAPTLAPRARGFAAVLARLLVPVVEASADGRWRRVKACRAAALAGSLDDPSRCSRGPQLARIASDCL
jgi:hypothetical protein